jgi:hypothetical protein
LNYLGWSIIHPFDQFRYRHTRNEIRAANRSFAFAVARHDDTLNPISVSMQTNHVRAQLDLATALFDLTRGCFP